MVTAKTNEGKRMFKADEILRPDQITSYFSQLSKDARQGLPKKGPKKAKLVEQPEDISDDSEDDEINEDVIEAQGDEIQGRVLRRSQRLVRSSLQHQAEEEINNMYHAIENNID
uniref:Uncharacterized protein n=1 Tax=Panagrolaimus superbus TaxID=310955 RepID=A0A914Z6C9_9BILA